MSSSADTFTVFPKLAAELQLQILRFAAEQSRVVVIHVAISDGNSYVFKSPTPNPAVLYLSRELRTEALKIYQAVFSSKAEDEKKDKGKRIYMNPEIDTPFVIPDPALQFHGTPQLALSLCLRSVEYALLQNRCDFPHELVSFKKFAIQLLHQSLLSWSPARFTEIFKYFKKAREVGIVINDLPPVVATTTYKAELAIEDAGMDIASLGNHALNIIEYEFKQSWMRANRVTLFDITPSHFVKMEVEVMKLVGKKISQRFYWE